MPIEFTMKHPSQIIKRGYTLVELMVAISILALLFAAGVATYSKATQRSRDATRKSDVEQMRSALEMYRADNGYYPPKSCIEPCNSYYQIDDTNLGELTGYIQKFPTDPLGAFYYYKPSNIVVTPSPSKAYGYCIYAILELASTDDLSGCTDKNVSSTGDYAVKNP